MSAMGFHSVTTSVTRQKAVTFAVVVRDTSWTMTFTPVETLMNVSGKHITAVKNVWIRMVVSDADALLVLSLLKISHHVLISTSVRAENISVQADVSIWLVLTGVGVMKKQWQSEETALVSSVPLYLSLDNMKSRESNSRCECFQFQTTLKTRGRM